MGVIALVAHLPLYPLCGQTVEVEVRDVSSNRLLSGAIVSVDTGFTSPETSAITNENGRASLRVRPARQNLLSVRRIGYAPVHKSISDATHAVVKIDMRANPVALEPVAIQVQSTCGSLRAEPGIVSRLWQDIELALEASVLSDAESNHPMEIEKYERDLDGRHREQRKTVEIISRFTNQPFSAASGKDLEENGYVRKRNESDYYYAPDARTLLSDEFAGSHCFFPHTTSSSSDLVGLRFDPKAWVTSPNIKGVLWVKAKTSELRTLDYEYVNLPLPIPVPGIGGRIEFEKLPSGEWFINKWVIRTPRVGRITRSGAGWNANVVVDTLIGFHEVGAVVRNISQRHPDDLAGVAASPVYTLAGRVVNVASGVPVTGAEITVAGTKMQSDSVGRFTLTATTRDSILVNIRKIGFVAANFGGVFSENTEQPITFGLRPIAPVLDTITVRRAVGLLATRGFDERRRNGIGSFLNRAQLESHGPRQLGEILAGAFGARLVRMSNGQAALASSRGGAGLGGKSRGGDPSDFLRGAKRACYTQVFVDGVRVFAPAEGAPLFDVNSLDPTEIEAVEYYRGPAETPVRFATPDSECGTLVVWTRIGEYIPVAK